MNEDAFARRYYADRMELTGLGVAITVEHPVDGVAEQETYSLRRESFHLPAIAFTDAELAGLHTARRCWTAVSRTPSRCARRCSS